MGWLDELMLRYGAKPVWLTELGWATDRGPHGVTEDAQAQFLARTYLMALAPPSVEKIFWYDFRNDSSPGAPYDQPAYNDREHEFHFGLLRRTFPLDPNAANLRKPAFLAYRTMTSMLAGQTFQQTIADGRRGDMPSTYWYRFGGGRRVDVIWNTDTPQPDHPDPLRVPRGAGAPLERPRALPALPENGVFNPPARRAGLAGLSRI